MQETQLQKVELGSTGLEITRVGFRRPDQVDPILAAANLELTEADLAEIEHAWARRAA
jgi:aryl-alcohol dehydrogenase-like predicted oxidoreductase